MTRKEEMTRRRHGCRRVMPAGLYRARPDLVSASLTRKDTVDDLGLTKFCISLLEQSAVTHYLFGRSR